MDEITVHYNKDVDIKIQNLFAGVVLHNFSSKDYEFPSELVSKAFH